RGSVLQQPGAPPRTEPSVEAKSRAQADVVVTEGRHAPGTVGAAAAPRGAGPGPAPEDAGNTPGGPPGISSFCLRIVVPGVAVLAPLQRVAVHVAHAEPIGPEPAHRGREDVAVLRRDRRPAGELLSRAAVSHVAHFRQGIVPVATAVA